ncbi:FAS1 domain-containing protein [Stipitochalara longipes BDJ]|nr:FAS1 domain-containing protein [Stipitochalara longipes BDJ]
MELLCFFLFVFISHVQSQALLSVLQQHVELSTFNHYVNSSSALTSLLSSANNITLLAPSNTAFQTWLEDQSPPLSDDQIEALLSYHVLHGVFPTVSLAPKPQFANSFLTNTSYANVTSGQRVELLSTVDGDPQIVSGNKSISGFTTKDVLFTGGLIQIIDTVLTIPLSYVILVTQANFRFVVAILTAGGYLSPSDTTLVNAVLYRPNMTFFAPNTQAALTAFTARAPTMSTSQLAATFNYHAVPNFIGYSSQLTNGMQLQTSEGTNLTITIQGNETFVNGARILISDYLVANGVVHLIDR